MSESPTSDGEAQAAPDTSMRALLRQRDFVFFWCSRWTAVLGVQIMSVALGWHVYDIARRTMGVKESAFMVSMIGLVSFVPVLLLALPAGETADRHNRRKILLFCYSGEIAVALGLTLAAFFNRETIPLLLGAAVLFGVARAFFAPANTALGPMLVPRELLPRAIAWNSLAWQTASIIGPAVGGLLIVVSLSAPYAVAACLYVVAMGCILMVRGNAQPQVQPGSRWALMKEGLSYVWNNKIVFGAISLDLAAVILGGATALLPVFARDVLHVDSWGFGILRAGPAIGAAAVAVYLAANPIRSRAGLIMFASVALFGLGTIAFGLSNYLWLSVAALILLGGADMVSVYVRQTLIQLATPDHMRGRVATVSSLFIGASNELGEFESGVVARFLGPVGAAVFGGVGALAVTGIWAWMFPALRKADRLV
ncbi:MFS transporter [Caulobacter sp. SLTY]|uniref:MFS transporter n=1 Tax=Caulobacter sp. SLTY TaxID=2683262 RepID=UPI0014120090|nr:MFS transporter [Caulobacter sp. SLTY]NBB14474.1 MFS transporter [Caulobacter sp. SLTY]